MAFVEECKPDQATFVPDSENQFTSDHGWALDMMGSADKIKLKTAIDAAHAVGTRVSLFMDPIASLMPLAKALGADRVELYTEGFAKAHSTVSQPQAMKQYADACRAAVATGLEVNAGHDLNLQNLSDFLIACPAVKEVSIGHALIADALEMGYAATVQAYNQCIEVGLGLAPSVTPAHVHGPGCGHDHHH
jgi:pyridoxine 5-phosphate synthase